jgi:outer membrane protein assembly factor BamB
MVYTGASDGHFRALRLSDGVLQWDFKDVKGFVESQPLFYEGRIFFASWGNEVYALDTTSGKLAWKWNNGATNRMFSAASCLPVATKGKLFIVAPDRYMTALDTRSGTAIWRRHWGQHLGT